MTTLLDIPSLKNKIFTLLARREYSRAELFHRLKNQAESTVLLNDLLDEMAREGYQSDQRFTESFVRQRIAQCWGPKRIYYELSQKGISKENVTQVLETMSPDWNQLALELLNKRFKEVEGENQKETAKRMRYLLNHGFNYDNAKYALDYKNE